ncbi:LCP family protein [Cohnella caldifontis]|uniref:LCP family protein n=1 Tax=Cohnella caldifontis TaxID=3027471 RepID=UPI0023EC3D61|nr:LCP family protein [Cohnella sp. YIM B05605]
MNRPRKRTLSIIGAAAALLIAAALIGYANRGVLAAWGYDTFLSKQVEKKLEKSYEPLPNRPPETSQPTAAEREDPFSVLLMGVDARGSERGRSDTLIYTVIRPVDGHVLMVSIPRDTYAELVGRGAQDKITHAYVYGGPQMAVESVQKLLDARIDHYASINFQGFVKAVDLLGGIPLPITKDIVNKEADHEKFTIKANQSVYSGQDALNFVRYREDAGGDMARTERNRQFLESLIHKASSLQQWSKIPELLTVVGENFRTDIPPSALSDLAKKFLQTDHSIQSYTLHGEGKRMGPDNLWYYVADEEDLNAVRQTIAVWLDPDAASDRLTVPGLDEKTPTAD